MKKIGYVFVPSGATIVDGTVVTVQGFYIAETEVSNASYRVFLDSLKAAHDTLGLEIANMDSTKWNLPNASMESIVAFYGNHTAFKEYPAVNVSQEGAKLYCQWLEKKLNQQGIRAKVRLPEKAEWVMAARGGHAGNIYAWDGDALRNKRGIYLANFKTEHTAEDGTYLTAITRSYPPNDYGIYNMCGNVSEWLADYGMSKGGSWWSEAEFIRIDAPQEYPVSSTASPFIGFRPVISIIE